MNIRALLSLLLIGFFSVLPFSVSAQTIPVLETYRLLKISGSLRLACYVQGTNLLIGRTIPSTNSGTGLPMDIFEVRGADWVRNLRAVEARELRELRTALNRATGSRRARLQQELRVATRNYQKVNNQTNAVLGPPCLNHHAWVVGMTAPAPTPTLTPTPTDDPDQDLLDLDENIFRPTIRDPHGLALISPRQDTTLLFVDSFSGNDTSNNGFTDDAPFRTVARALQYLNTIAVSGRVNAQVFLKRGGTYAIGELILSGKDHENPLLFGAYGDLTAPRPRMSPVNITGNVSNLAFSDLLFEAPIPGSGTAFNVSGMVVNLLIQNSRIVGFRNGIVVEGSNQSRDISIYRNIITELSSLEGPSYGVRLDNIFRAIVSSNVLDRIGESTTPGFVPAEESTAISVTNSLIGGVVRGNQIFRSPTAITLVSNSEAAMAHVHANARVRSGVAGTIESRGVYLGENVVIEGTDVGPLNRGRGFHIRNGMAVQVYRNIVANTVSSTVPEDYALKFSGAAHFGFYDVAGLDIYNAADLHVGGFSWDSDKTPNTLAFKDSAIQNNRSDGANEPLVTLQGRPQSVVKSAFRRLRLNNSTDPSERFYRIVEEGSITRVNRLQRRTLWRWYCYGLELVVSPNLRKQTNNWYSGFEIHQGVVNTASRSIRPNRFRFNRCLNGYRTGPYTAQQRVNRTKWVEYADDQGTVHAPTTYQDPSRTPGQMLAANSLPGASLDQFIAYVTTRDRGNFDYRFIGQRLSQWIRVGFNRQ